MAIFITGMTTDACTSGSDGITNDNSLFINSTGTRIVALRLMGVQ